MHRRHFLTATLLGATALAAACAREPTEPTITDVVTQNESLSTLAAAVEAAGLGDALAGDGPFTLFAPTNSAFDALPAGTVDALLQPGNEGQLADILQYHVLPNTVATAGDLLAAPQGEITMLNGDILAYDATEGPVTVGGAQVIQPDVLAGNGVVHVINAVLLPPE